MSNISVAIINYECGNIHSASKALEFAISESNLKGKVVVTNNPDTIKKSDRLVLPGVGAFSKCYQKLNAIKGLKESIQEKVFEKGTPILGICVGLQLMADQGHENETIEGLGWIPGEVISLNPRDKNLKSPHMGWNEIKFKKNDNYFSELERKNFYFVHSYYFEAKEDNNILAETDYGVSFPSVLCKDNILGTQFHPEKSQKEGVDFLKKFLMWKP